MALDRGLPMKTILYRRSMRAGAGAILPPIRPQRALRAPGVTAAKRWPSLPEVPTIAKTIPGYETSAWYGISAPNGAPPEKVEILTKSVAAALADPKMHAKLVGLGGIPMPMSPAKFGKLIAERNREMGPKW
jgi:tripartite-type tricarboxylate transporter receptor subunit TctC